MSVHHDWSGLTAPDTFRYPSIRVQARRDFACFTRPELVSERVSYPVMTPTAAVGLLSATLWKPQFRWVIEADRGSRQGLMDDHEAERERNSDHA